MKLVLGLFTLMLAIGLSSYLLLRAAPEGDPCADRVLLEVRSPDERATATAYEHRCGASSTTHVALRPTTAQFAPRGDVFVVQGLTRPGLSWRDRELVIEAGTEKVLFEEPSWRTVTVRVQRVR